MKRRTFIKVTIAGIATTLAVSFFVLDFKRVTRRILLSDTENLDLESADMIDKFLEQAEEQQFWKQFSQAKRAFISIQHLFHSLRIRVPYRHKYFQYRSIITGQFLFSTDLFNDGNMHRKVRYITFFNPYKKPCGSPFPHLMQLGNA
jgi:hypothetical protein